MKDDKKPPQIVDFVEGRRSVIGEATTRRRSIVHKEVRMHESRRPSKPRM